jgi:hypothetical protein
MAAEPRAGSSLVGDLVGGLLDAVDLDAVLDALAQVSAFDRYQASAGIERAADVVAALAKDAGLVDVDVQRYRADGTAQWWTFEAPTSWTPTTARFVVDGLTVDHGEQPFALATHSAAVTAEAAPLVSAADDVRGAVVLLDTGRFETAGVFHELQRAGALGFVTDAPARRAGYRARIELPAGTGLFGFSLMPAEFETARRSRHADVRIRLGAEARMPVVSGLLPGRGDGEIWLMGHLCHPRPGANDNASGVAALLGVAQTLAAARRAGRVTTTELGIRFVWGPEFTGTAAVLHHRMSDVDGQLPVAVINLDMVGEDQQRCAAPFVVERPPDTLPSPLAALAEVVVAEAFTRTSAHAGTWQPAQFAGFSDHALFADPFVGRPAVQFCHPADRFNHSAADSLDKIAPVEMLRTTAAAAALAQLVADRGAGLDLADLLRRWCDAGDEVVRDVAQQHRDVEDGAWSDRLVAYTRRRRAATLASVSARTPRTTVRVAGKSALVRRWDGPLNVRAMLAAASAPVRDAVGDLVAADKANLSLVFNLGIRMSGELTRARLVDETSFARLRPVDPEIARVLLDAYVDAGWAGLGRAG